MEFNGFDRSVDCHISKPRRKLRDDALAPKRIKTIRGKGYQFSKHCWALKTSSGKRAACARYWAGPCARLGCWRRPACTLCSTTCTVLPTIMPMQPCCRAA
ncbi:hypothetical protein C6P77_18300 [Burkholderia ambifaria]|uniref:Winged helix-turn-helix domain-containing protein n=1 Tax=Burkholderia ambifaria TaxID=152480 RepID=A0AA41ECR3_9BURK|nr:winged helix-turn-helix domain-containing protein [Burkholderia ambifaria]PRD98747.1 hypothetical protein C6P77_18300 [Burkholderia ambifaria]